jgi:uracil-DNA glycosylase family 4
MNLAELNQELIDCRRCSRLVDWREVVARQKRRAFMNWDYWGRPVPGFGDPDARLIVVGLAPGAHGANRTGRMFTGDRSGDWLYAALHRAGFANQPASTHREDGLALSDCYITAVVRCAPPANKPLTRERDECSDWLRRELELLSHRRVIVTLGQFSFNQTLRLLGAGVPRPRPKFGHGAEVHVQGGPVVIASYHPSQQNTFTGRLTADMLDAVFSRAATLLAGPLGEAGGRP